MASHLSLEEREVIAHMHRAGSAQTQIADRLGRHKSTISRELRRNRSRNGYWVVAAQRKAERRRSERPWKGKMERPEVRPTRKRVCNGALFIWSARRCVTWPTRTPKRWSAT